jgi:hypothetical protein
MDKALIEKAQEYAEKNVIFRGGKVVCGMAIASAFTSGATWQREQLEAEIKQDAHGTHSGNTGGQNE